ncbi:MAG: tetratricopeptide repeat protein, partial [Bacteroidota bacterium]
ISLHSQESAMEGLSESYPLIYRPFLVSYAISFYLIKFIFPFHLSVLHPYPSLYEPLPVIYFLSPVIILLVVFLIIVSKSLKKELIFGFLFFLISIGLVIQIIPVGQAIAAERYTYVPYIGLLFIIGQVFYWLKENKYKLFNKYQNLLLFSFFIYAIGFSIGTIKRLNVWKDSMALFNDQIKKYPSHYFGFFSRGNFKIQAKDYPGALQDFNKSLEIKPKNADCLNSRSNAKYYLKDYKGALNDLNRVIEINPAYQIGYKNRAEILSQLGMNEDAIKDYDQLIKLTPNYAFAYYKRGLLKNKMGKKQEACDDLKIAIKLGYHAAKKELDNLCTSQQPF